MRVRPCSAIYHPRSVSSHRGRKDLGCVFAFSSCHLFLKSTRFSVTVVYCILCRENKHQHGGFVYTRQGPCLGFLYLHTLCLVQNTSLQGKMEDDDECGKYGERSVKCGAYFSVSTSILFASSTRRSAEKCLQLVMN